jgi:hypothetical protein
LPVCKFSRRSGKHTSATLHHHSHGPFRSALATSPIANSTKPPERRPFRHQRACVDDREPDRQVSEIQHSRIDRRHPRSFGCHITTSRSIIMPSLTPDRKLHSHSHYPQHRTAPLPALHQQARALIAKSTKKKNRSPPPSRPSKRESEWRPV